eukprot:1159192-Pelagomonas_calceolata.AAC.4
MSIFTYAQQFTSSAQAQLNNYVWRASFSTYCPNIIHLMNMPADKEKNSQATLPTPMRAKRNMPTDEWLPTALQCPSLPSVQGKALYQRFFSDPEP